MEGRGAQPTAQAHTARGEGRRRAHARRLARGGAVAVLRARRCPCVTEAGRTPQPVRAQRALCARCTCGARGRVHPPPLLPSSVRTPTPPTPPPPSHSETGRKPGSKRALDERCTRGTARGTGRPGGYSARSESARRVSAQSSRHDSGQATTMTRLDPSQSPRR